MTVGELRDYIRDHGIPDNWHVGVMVPTANVDEVSTGASHWDFNGETGFLEIEVM